MVRSVLHHNVKEPHLCSMALQSLMSESAEYGISVHSSSLHCTMSPLSLQMFCTKECTAAPVPLGGE